MLCCTGGIGEGGGRSRSVHVQSIAMHRGAEDLAEDVVALREQLIRLKDEQVGRGWSGWQGPGWNIHLARSLRRLKIEGLRSLCYIGSVLCCQCCDGVTVVILMNHARESSL